MVLRLNGQDWLGWTGFGWVGCWVELDRAGLRWVGLAWAALNQATLGLAKYFEQWRLGDVVLARRIATSSGWLGLRGGGEFSMPHCLGAGILDG